MNHDQLTALGFVRQPDGNYAKPKRGLPAQVLRETPNPVHQRVVPHDALAAHPRKEEHPKRLRVSIVSCRHRLLDFDNLVGGSKYFCDALRYAGAIPGDRPQDIELQVSQRKIDRKTEETTEILITEI